MLPSLFAALLLFGSDIQVVKTADVGLSVADVAKTGLCEQHSAVAFRDSSRTLIAWNGNGDKTNLETVLQSVKSLARQAIKDIMVVRTVYGEEIIGKPKAILDGALVLSNTSERRIPLSEILQISWSDLRNDAKLKKTKSNTKKSKTLTRPQAYVDVHLHGYDRIRGQSLSLENDSLTLNVSADLQLLVPLSQVTGIRFGNPNKGTDAKLFQKLLKNPKDQDNAIVSTGGKIPTTISGVVERFAEGKLGFHYDGATRSIKQDRLAGVVFAASPPLRKGSKPYQIFHFSNGGRISAKLVAIASDGFKMTTSWGGALVAPVADLESIDFRNGMMVYLSDLEPKSVQEVPYFDRLLSFRRDISLDGKPLKINDKLYNKGIAVHSRCVLTYRLDQAFETFKVDIGFDENAGGRGRIACRLLGDDKVLFSESDLRGDQKPVSVSVSVSGVTTLTLEAGFGEHEDIGDRLIWANPRLFREKTD